MTNKERKHDTIVFFSIHIDDDDNDDYCGEVPSLLPQFFVHCMTTTPC